MLEPKNPDEVGGDGAKPASKEQQTDQLKPTDPKAEEGTASTDGLDK